MHRFLLFLLILAASVWIGVKITTDPGYVLITWHHIAIEMSIWLVFLGLIISFTLVYFLIRLIKCFVTLPKNWCNHLNHKRQQKLAFIDNQRLFTIIYQKPQNWYNILEVLPQLEKKSWISKQQIQNLQQEAYKGLLSEEKYSLDQTTLETMWHNLSPLLRKDPVLLNYYILALIRHHEDEKAEFLILKQLKKQWFGPIVATYSRLHSTNPTRQLSFTEKWLKKHPDDSYLLLSLGRLCRQRKLWGKARDYLEKSLIYDPANTETYLELGELFEDLEEPLQALTWFKKALLLHCKNNLKL